MEEIKLKLPKEIPLNNVAPHAVVTENENIDSVANTTLENQRKILSLENEIKQLKQNKRFSTKQLVEELKKREGIDTIIVEPYEKKNISVDGSAIVLIVTD